MHVSIELTYNTWEKLCELKRVCSSKNTYSGSAKNGYIITAQIKIGNPNVVT